MIFFTLCSKNYLSQATVLYNSFKHHHPQVRFIIGLVDVLTPSEKEQFSSYDIIEMDSLKEPAFESMKARYNIVELNTAVKPYYINYFFKSLHAQKVVYLDPDILVLSKFDNLLNALDNYSFIITPHFCSPIYDKCLLTEQITLGTGTFNLGFFAVRNDENGRSLINWWSRKLFDECIMDLSRGYFVDQKWMNLCICHFDNFLIDKNPGLNAAHWNLHERTFSKNENGQYMVNEQFPLVFFHFSSYRPDKPDEIASWQNRYSFAARPDIVPLFDCYRELLQKHNYDEVRQLRPVYGNPMPVAKKGIKENIKNRLISIISKL